MDWSQIGAESFAKGIQSGGDFARAKLQLDQQASQLQLQRQQFEQTKRQNQIEMGKDMLTRVENATKMENGPAKNAYLKGMQKIFAQYGFDNTEMLSAMLVDPQGLADFRTAFSQIYSLAPEQQNELWSKASQFLASPELNVYLKDFIAKMGEFERLKKEGEAKGSDPQVPLNLSKAAEGAVKDLDRVKTAVAGIDKIIAEVGEGGKIGYRFNLLTGAEDFQLVKAFNQLNDTAAVRDGEFQTVLGLQSVSDWARTTLQNWREGDKLSPTQRREIYNATKRIETALDESVQNKLSPLRKQAEAFGIPLEQVFGEQTQAILKKKVTPWKDIKEPKPGSPPPKNGVKVAGVPPEPEDILKRYPEDVVKTNRALVKALGGNMAEIKKRLEPRLKAQGQEFPEELFRALGAK